MDLLVRVVVTGCLWALPVVVLAVVVLAVVVLAVVVLAAVLLTALRLDWSLVRTLVAEFCELLLALAAPTVPAVRLLSFGSTDTVLF